MLYISGCFHTRAFQPAPYVSPFPIYGLCVPRHKYSSTSSTPSYSRLRLTTTCPSSQFHSSHKIPCVLVNTETCWWILPRNTSADKPLPLTPTCIILELLRTLAWHVQYAGHFSDPKQSYRIQIANTLLTQQYAL